MPSSISFNASAASKSTTVSIYTRPQKKQKMSITQSYYLAHSARSKLSKEASRSDHDLRLLVGHANLLDSLMIDLANAEQEQESWFNKSVSGAKASEEETSTASSSHQWAETVVEEPEADWEVEDAESTDDESLYDDDDEDVKMSTSTVITTTEMDEEDDDEDDEELALTRTPSRHTPPELSADSDSDSEDEPMPSSPPEPKFEAFTEKQRQAIVTTSFYDKKDAALSPTEQETFQQDGFYLPSRQMIAAF